MQDQPTPETVTAKAEPVVNKVDRKQLAKEKNYLRRKNKARERMNQFLNDLMLCPEALDPLIEILVSSRKFMGIMVKATSVNVMTAMEAVREQKRVLDNNEHFVINYFDIEKQRDEAFENERIILEWIGPETSDPISLMNKSQLNELLVVFCERPSGESQMLDLKDANEPNRILMSRLVAVVLNNNQGVIAPGRQHLLALELNPTLIENRNRVREAIEAQYDNAIAEAEYRKNGGLPGEEQ